MIRNIISLSETGLQRLDNQDAIFVANAEHVGIFAVADGMGGHYRGELASKMAATLLEEWWEKIRDCIGAMPFYDVVNELEKKVRSINEGIYQMYYEMGQLGGTTLCLLLIQKAAYVVINVGDSRMYRCQGWDCMQATSDDVQDQSQGGLTQALGAQERISPNIFSGVIKKKTCFFLCSDGIYKYCEEKYLFSRLRSLMWRKTASVAEQIRKRVYQNGAKDNLSMIFVEVDTGKIR